MRRIVATAAGGYKTLKVEHVSLPSSVLGPKQVNVQVHAAGMNFADIYSRQGLSPYFQPPCTLGIECAGMVLSIGEQVKQIKVGDRVAVTSFLGGAFSEQIVTEESSCSPVPEIMSWDEAAAIKINYLTAYLSLFPLGGLQPHQTVFTHNAAGGVGWAVTQLAKTLEGVTVIGRASQEKHQIIQDNGVDHALHYDQDHVKEIRQLTPNGVNLVLDMYSGSSLRVSQDLLKPFGKMVILGALNLMDKEFANPERIEQFQESVKDTVTAANILNKSIGVAGLNLAEILTHHPSVIPPIWKTLMNLYEDGHISPRLDSVWRFEEIVEATKILEDRKNIGKVILKV
ncbi:unnamed protein product [Meganyctiphanes norvegica]|uniref:Enoyl reductase (ER) domain-containing protein n=1 Tax=Meganyctiphanes norvegica TaxID=48144 RepID=A0AAV2R892_MEGNR